MAHLIDKDALVAEIERIIADENESIKSFEHGKNISEVQRSNARIGVLTHLRSLLDTLEVKGVNLKKRFSYEDYDGFFKEHPYFPNDWGFDEAWIFAKYFFELGLNASNPLTWKDIKEICVQSVLVEIDLGGLVSDERHYTEVLKRFKAQKGE